MKLIFHQCESFFYITEKNRKLLLQKLNSVVQIVDIKGRFSSWQKQERKKTKISNSFCWHTHIS
jgi:hypothetical protein